MKEILKYKKIKTLKQYNQYCDKLEELIYKEDKSFKDEIELLEILIEVYDRNLQKETSKKLNPVELLKSILTDADMNQKELAVHLGVSKQLINDVLGYRRNISKSLVTKLSKFFKMSEEAFSRAYELNPNQQKEYNITSPISYAKEEKTKYKSHAKKNGMPTLNDKDKVKFLQLTKKETISIVKEFKKLLTSDKFKDFESEVKKLEAPFNKLLLGGSLSSKEFLDRYKIKDENGILQFEEINELYFSIVENLETIEKYSTKNNTLMKDAEPINWLAFKGTMSKQPLNDVDQQLNELRNEWE